MTRNPLGRTNLTQEELTRQGIYSIQNYNQASAFSSFLPGIAGLHGTPLWCFYVNRGQCVTSFGHSNKNQPILEFRPADQAYRDTERLGFRTFVKIQGQGVSEPFGENALLPLQRTLFVGQATLHIQEQWKNGLLFDVEYATLPGESYPALIRHLTITNTSSTSFELEILDGLPRIVPYGIHDGILKNMSATAAAWIETDCSIPQIPSFRIRASISDTINVEAIKGGHFMSAVVRRQGIDQPLIPITDASVIFGSNLGFSNPTLFREKSLHEIRESQNILLGRYPCGFAGFPASLSSGESLDLHSLFGFVEQPHRQRQKNWENTPWFESKIQECIQETHRCIEPYQMKTALPILDAYTAQTALDNTLRGGMPMIWSQKNQTQVFYVYGRKHGDLERDYNDFNLPSTRYSAGFGNYRDINQNRRLNVFTYPEIGNYDIRLFMDLIQPDGHNPLLVYPGSFLLTPDMRNKLQKDFPEKAIPENENLTPGNLYDRGFSQEEISKILLSSRYQPKACFGEGYWVDHWTYNLDLIDQYLRIFPEKDEHLFFGQSEYRWFSSNVRIRPLTERFRMEDSEIIHEDHIEIQNITERFLPLRSTLMEKLLILALVKSASLGYEECGLEMNAGRPGWYDALNGLPGLFGSSISDGVELLRLFKMLIPRLKETPDRSITLFLAAWQLLENLETLNDVENRHQRWLARHSMLALYRDSIYGHEIDQETRTSSALISYFCTTRTVLEQNLEKAKKENNGYLPTFYYFEICGWKELAPEKVIPSELQRKTLPLFLEGMVKQLKMASSPEEKLIIHKDILSSPLYDKSLRMFLLNASISSEPASIGRAQAFPSGWLENGSIWLHMEYKYLLELLRSGNDAHFWNQAFHTLIPFLEREQYGRSLFENSSFLASSAFPDSSLHGRGFVGRLSGATAEYLTIWSEFLLGQHPFQRNKEGVIFQPQPSLPSRLFPKNGRIEFQLFHQTQVIYRNPERIDLFRGNYSIEKISIHRKGTKRMFSSFLPAPYAKELRKGEIQVMEVYFQGKFSN